MTPTRQRHLFPETAAAEHRERVKAALADYLRRVRGLPPEPDPLPLFPAAPPTQKHLEHEVTE